MAELTFKSPGVSTREIDLSGPTARTPQGVPAGIIGTATKGRAFVPITIATYQDFVAEFGGTDGEQFGPLAMYEWMQNARAGTYVRVLGVGDGLKRVSGGNNSGRVNRAGFIVGSQQVQETGLLADNRFAGADTSKGGILGRTYFLGALMRSGSSTSTIFADAGIAVAGQSTDRAIPIVRGVLMAPSGVMLGLSSSWAANNAPAQNQAASGTYGEGPGASSSTGDAGAQHGTVDIANGRSNFVLLLNGLRPSAQYSNIITASLDPTSAEYFANVFNTDPTKIEEAGHYLYANWDVYPSMAVVTASGVQTNTGAGNPHHGSNQSEAAFLLTGSQARDTGTSYVPNYERFSDRYQTAFSPWVISQKFGGSNKSLFKVHALDDGARANDLFKITIENIAASNNENNRYGSFDLVVRSFYDNDENPVVLEAFRGLSLNVDSERYVSRVIGDLNMYYDFDQAKGAQKLRIDGVYPNRSRYIRIEAHTDLDRKVLDASAIPCGFRGHHFLLTSGSSGTSGTAAVYGWLTGSHGVTNAELQAAQVPPVPYRKTLTQGSGLKKTLASGLTWGVQFEVRDNSADLNQNTVVDKSIASFTRYFPRFHDSWKNAHIGDSAGTSADGGLVLDSDVFQNALFTLENVQVSTGSTDRPISNRWGAAEYRRTGVKAADLTDADGTTYDSDCTRFLDASKDFSHLPSKKYLKFTFFMQGGFDGLNIFDKQAGELSDIAARNEFGQASQGKISGPTIASFRKAIDVMEEKSDVDIQLLAIPGMRHEAITDYAMDAVEDRFDALYIMDIEEKDQNNSFVTGSSLQIPNVTYTVNRFEARNMDSSFAAAYYPDVVMTDPRTNTNVQVPPSVAVIGAFALNDAVAHPWYAPAGFSRGALRRTIEAQVKLNRANLDALYEADINPITSFPHSNGVVVFGQKTLQAAQSSLDRVNVRRLLIEIRRRVKKIALSLLFEPNRADTLARFSAAVNPVLQQIQAQQGLDRFKVQIDTTTTTQADVENNTIRGKIFLQPTRSLEFISLDFVVTNQGAEI